MTSDEISWQPNYGSDVSPNDVLLGRGAPSVRHEGNIRFRMLIKEHSEEYTSTSRQQEGKDKVARSVIQSITARKGRFLQRIDTPGHADTEWIPCLDEEVVLDKVKQAFRDTRSMKRRKKSKFSSSKKSSKSSISKVKKEADLAGDLAESGPSHSLRGRQSAASFQTVANILQHDADLALRRRFHASAAREQRERESQPSVLLDDSLLGAHPCLSASGLTGTSPQKMNTRQLLGLDSRNHAACASLAEADHRRHIALQALRAQQEVSLLAQQTKSLRGESAFLAGVPQSYADVLPLLRSPTEPFFTGHDLTLILRARDFAESNEDILALKQIHIVLSEVLSRGRTGHQLQLVETQQAQDALIRLRLILEPLPSLSAAEQWLKRSAKNVLALHHQRMVDAANAEFRIKKASL